MNPRLFMVCVDAVEAYKLEDSDVPQLRGENVYYNAVSSLRWVLFINRLLIDLLWSVPGGRYGPDIIRRAITYMANTHAYTITCDTPVTDTNQDIPPYYLSYQDSDRGKPPVLGLRGMPLTQMRDSCKRTLYLRPSSAELAPARSAAPPLSPPVPSRRASPPPAAALYRRFDQ
jgi:hypothetical protein